MRTEKLLLVVDMQNDFVSGVLGSEQAKAIVPNVVDRIHEYLENGWNVLLTLDTHAGKTYHTTKESALYPSHCIFRTSGWNFVPEFQDFLGEIIREEEDRLIKIALKETFGSAAIARQVHLRAEKEIEIIGLCTDICVEAMYNCLQEQNDDEKKITIDFSCCAGSTNEAHEEVRARLEQF